MPPGSVVGPERVKRLSPLLAVVATVWTAALVGLVVADVFPSGTAGLALGLDIGRGLGDAWERRALRRFHREDGRRLVRPKKSSGIFRREYFAAA